MNSDIASWQHNEVVGQAQVRLLFGAVFSFYAWFASSYSVFGSPPAELFYISAVFLITASVFLLNAVAVPSSTWIFKTAGMIIDITFATYCIIIGGYTTVYLYGIYLWIIIGNGFRFGRYYMYLANVLSVIGFSIATAYGEFWQHYPFIAGGLMFWLLLMPIYVGKFLHKLENAIQQADHANKAKGRFLANMSHEMRTPLTAIIGFSETALDDDQTTTERISALRTINSSSNHLLELINNILDFSKIDAGALNVEHIDMNPMQLVSEVESIIQTQAQHKSLEFNVEYRFPLPREINNDPVRLKQILLNLCGNAVKFTEQGSVKLILSFDTDKQLLVFTISDTGIGMTPEQIQHVFHPFMQADSSTTRRFGGTGLGLSLSKQLTELLDGELKVHSNYGKGSTFEVRIPCHEVTQEELIFGRLNIEDSKETPTTGRNEIPKLSGAVLVAEDNEMNQQLLKVYLDKIGVSVTLAQNGQEAVDLAENNKFDLIFMDMQMPVMSGVDAIRALRAADFTMPIIVLTANATKEDRQLCEQSGCNDFVTKPIVRQTLYDVLARYLSPANNIESDTSNSSFQSAG